MLSKSSYKKVVSTLIVSSIVLGLLVNPVAIGMTENELLIMAPSAEFSNYIKDVENGLIDTNSSYIPSPLQRPNAIKIDDSRLRGAGVLPVRYDLRELNRVTVPKDQGLDGVCWAFASTGSIESNIIRINSQQKDYSENHMRYALSNESGNIYGFNRTIDSGGNPEMATAYYTRWDGPVEEVNDPYSASATPRPITDTFNKDTKPVVKHVQNVIQIPDPGGTLESRLANQSYIKECVMNYGAVVSSMYSDDIYFNNQSISQDSYHYPANGSESFVNHNILIVGWDDDYSVNNFNGQYKPLNNGAFIVKNSWGTNWGDSGYFYISYEDKFIGEDSTVFISAEETNNYTNIYQYDIFGKTASMGYSGLSGGYANVFNRKSAGEKLSAAGFYTSNENMSYEIWVNASNSTFAQSVKVKSGTIDLPGYYTIKLDQPIDITGTKFIVAVKLTAPAGSVNVYPIAIEAPISGYSENATSNEYESYISSSGVGGSFMGSWTELSTTGNANCNVCIKAYTIDESIVPTPTLTATTIPTSSPTGTVIPTSTPVPTVTPIPTGSSTPIPTISTNPTPTGSIDPTNTPEVTPITFPDVGNGYFDWAQESIEYLAGIGVINGILGNDGILYYMPQNTVTRSQFCKLIVKSYDYVQEGIAVQFPDVNEGHWAINDIAIASSQGIVKGYDDFTFRPDAVITRQELCVMISRAMKKQNVGVPVISDEINALLDVFNDKNDISGWAREDVAFAVKNDIVKGNPEGSGFSFYPLKTATRAETAVIIKRAYDKKQLE